MISVIARNILLPMTALQKLFLCVLSLKHISFCKKNTKYETKFECGFVQWQKTGKRSWASTKPKNKKTLLKIFC